MLAVASLKRSLEFDPVEQGAKRKRAEMKLSPPSSPSSSPPSTSATTTTFTANANPPSPTKQQPIFTSSPAKNSSLVLRKPCSLTALSTSTATNDDIPLFNYAQTTQICARLLREQDRSIREQYEQIFTNKLTEQYNTFIRYTHDSVYRDQSKQRPSNRLFEFAQPQETNNASTSAFSYVS